jgi:hypothetical protein
VKKIICKNHAAQQLPDLQAFIHFAEVEIGILDSTISVKREVGKNKGVKIAWLLGESLIRIKGIMPSGI